MMILSGLLLFLFMFTGKRHSLNKWEGGFLLLSYAGYLFFLFFIQA
jgi:cation:H+ antiporter